MSQLNPDDLRVQSFATSEQATIGGGTLGCCTGCVSGCGINPTAGYCESKGEVPGVDQPAAL
jgi:hypothetical protein